MPGDQPGRHEIETRQVPLNHIHIDIETGFSTEFDHTANICQCLGINPSSIRLQQRPQGKYTHMIRTQLGYLRQIPAYDFPIWD